MEQEKDMPNDGRKSRWKLIKRNKQRRKNVGMKLIKMIHKCRKEGEHNRNSVAIQCCSASPPIFPPSQDHVTYLSH